MTVSTWRGAIAVLTLATAGIHFALVPPMAQALGVGATVPFILNGVGYLTLLAAFWLRPPFLAGREKLLHYAFMAFAAVTIVAYFAVNGAASFSNPIGLVDKVIELALIGALWQHLRLAAK
ncbi:MAG: hypothetical protein JNK29_19205 [Anaerolineales bacterium]|nr:hypothetical protein [Anaerolineales bacterium]